jgi:hypothetical protein
MTTHDTHAVIDSNTQTVQAYGACTVCDARWSTAPDATLRGHGDVQESARTHVHATGHRVLFHATMTVATCVLMERMPPQREQRSTAGKHHRAE